MKVDSYLFGWVVWNHHHRWSGNLVRSSSEHSSAIPPPSRFEPSNHPRRRWLQNTTDNTPRRNPIFGTRNGYDQGGTEAMCWKTTWNSSNVTPEMRNISNLIERSNAQMFALSEQSQLLPACFEGTTLTVRSYDLDDPDSDSSQLFLGRPYTIQMDLQVDFQNVPVDLLTATTNTTNTSTMDAQEIYFRLHLCDAIQQGMCHPIRDTRAADAQLTRAQADQPLFGDTDEEQEPFPDNADKWVYNPNVTLNGLTENDEETVYYGRWCKWRLRRQNETSVYRTTIPVTIAFPLPPPDSIYNTMGAQPFYFVGQAVVPLGLNTDGEEVRLDISQTVSSKVVYVSPPPDIAVVGTPTKIVLGVAIGMAGSFALGCFLAICAYHKHAILRLAQAPFLAAIAAACCIQIVFSFSHLPVQDLYCRLRGFFVELPIAWVGAVLVGRVWRIYGTLSTIQQLGRRATNSSAVSSEHSNNNKNAKKPFLDAYVVGFLDALARIPFLLLLGCFPSKTKNKGGPHKSIRSAVTANETWCLIGMLMVPQVTLQVYAATMNDAQLITELTELGNVGRVVCGNMGNWVTLTGTGISCLLYLLAVIMAWLSRDLPFAFNEKDQIFHASTICAIITAMSIAVGRVIDDPSTSPSAVVLLQSFVSIGIALTVLSILVWPKIHRAWNGQPVVMSTVLGSSFSKSSHHHHPSASEATTASSTRDRKPSSDGEANPNNDAMDLTTATTTWNEHEALPSHIESQILDLQVTFRGVTDKCGNGCTLSKTEWQELQESIRKLNADLHHVHVE